MTSKKKKSSLRLYGLGRSVQESKSVARANARLNLEIDMQNLYASPPPYWIEGQPNAWSRKAGLSIQP